MNELSFDELACLLYYSFDDFKIKKSDKWRVINDRESIAARLYIKGEISLEKAAEIAGVNYNKMFVLIEREG